MNALIKVKEKNVHRECISCIFTFCTYIFLISFSVLGWNLIIYESVNIWYWTENTVSTKSEKEDDEETENEEDEEEESGEESDTEDDQSDCDKDVDDSCPCPKSAKGEEKMVSFVENHIVLCSTYTRYMNYWIYILSVLLRMFLTQAACGLSVGVGSFSDPPEIPGLAHFLEHMVFMGSEKYTEVYLSWGLQFLWIFVSLLHMLTGEWFRYIYKKKRWIGQCFHRMWVDDILFRNTRKTPSSCPRSVCSIFYQTLDERRGYNERTWICGKRYVIRDVRHSEVKSV